MRKPKLFWISAAAPLTSVILSTILVYLLRSKLHGVSTVRHKSSQSLKFSLCLKCFSNYKFNVQIGHLPKGLNPTSSNMLYFRGPYLGVAIKTGLITGILSLTVSYSKTSISSSEKTAAEITATIMEFFFFRVAGRNRCGKDVRGFKKLSS